VTREIRPMVPALYGIGLIFLAAGVLGLGGCGTIEVGVVGEPTAAAEASLRLDSNSETIRLKLLQSYALWQTAWVDGSATWYAPAGSNEPTQVFHFQIWVDAPNFRFLELTAPAGGAPTVFKVSDGQSVLDMDPETGDERLSTLPGFAQEGFDPPVEVTDTILPHPLAMVMDSPLRDLLFPTGLAERGGTYNTVQLESAAGRQALIVDWFREPAQRVDRFWVDVETGVILRMQHFGKGGGDVMDSDVRIEQIQYGVALETEIFNIPPRDLPGFVQSFGSQAHPTVTGAATSVEADPLGAIYFFVMDQGYPIPDIRLVRLGGSCVTGASRCSEPEVLATPFRLQFSLSPLVWSPDGTRAALAYPIRDDGNWAGLQLFDPHDQSWTVLAEFPFIDPPLWSLDGQWLVFRVQDGQGGEDIYAVRSDGSALHSVTSAEGLPREMAPYIADGWVGNSVLLRSEGSRGAPHLYLVDVLSSRVTPLSGSALTSARLVPSPADELLAVAGYQGQRVALDLLTLDGALVQRLAEFQDGGIHPLIWSPDGSQLAFGHTSERAPEANQDAYMVGRDGLGMRQVYSGQTVDNLIFSPDGQYLLVEGSTSTGWRLFVVSIASLERRLLQAPGLSLTDSWIAASWQSPR